jgi:hypothetical protein
VVLAFVRVLVGGGLGLTGCMVGGDWEDANGARLVAVKASVLRSVAALGRDGFFWIFWIFYWIGRPTFPRFWGAVAFPDFG